MIVELLYFRCSKAFLSPILPVQMMLIASDIAGLLFSFVYCSGSWKEVSRLNR